MKENLSEATVTFEALNIISVLHVTQALTQCIETVHFIGEKQSSVSPAHHYRLLTMGKWC